MTGCYGGNSIISSTLGGGILIDATKVRWLAYTGGSGTVPAIGTNITQGGVTSSYLLAVYATITSAPSTVGSTMPATGFIKFREVDGLFSAGTLTGITATASGADRVGWLEIVGQQSANFNIPRLGNFTSRGEWFYLDNTTGVANQNILIPTNGSATAYSPGIWIQDGTGGSGTYTWSTNEAIITFNNHQFVVGSEIDLNFTSGDAIDIEHHTYRIREVTANTFTVRLTGSGLGGNVAIESYDFYSAIYAIGFSTTNFGTDVRSKHVLMGSNGSITIGHNGTTNVGYVPLAGRKTRIPNILLRQCTSAARALNAIPHPTVTTRPDFTTTSGGFIDLEYTFGDWYYLFSQPYFVKLRHIGTHDSVNISECATELELSDGGTGSSAGLVVSNLVLTSNFAGGDIFSWIGAGQPVGAIANQVTVTFCIGQIFRNCRFGIWIYARSTSRFAMVISQSTDITVEDCFSLNSPISITTSFNVRVKNHDYCDRYRGNTNSTTALNIFAIANSCIGVLIDNVTFGFKGAIANVHPHNSIVTTAASSDVRIRNLGSRTNFLNGGSALSPAYIYSDGGNNVDVKLQRCYMQPTRIGAHLLTNSTKNILLEDVYGDWTDLMNIAALNCIVRGGGGRNGTSGQASVYGTHFGGAFDDDTTGRMWLALNEPTSETLQFTSRLFSPGSGFTSAGGLSLATVDDFFICEMQEYRLQTTGFQDTAPTLSGTNTQNYDYEYQIDQGNGWSDWKIINGTNLSSEIVLPNQGYKLKFRITCRVANNANLINYIRCDTTSTLDAQLNNLYPLDTFSFTVNGLKEELLFGESGSDVVIYQAGTSNVLSSAGSVTGFNYIYEVSEPIDIGIFKKGYIPLYVRNFLLQSENGSLPVSQVLDRAYLN
jgi:hypothetical protein